MVSWLQPSFPRMLVTASDVQLAGRGVKANATVICHNSHSQPVSALLLAGRQSSGTFQPPPPPPLTTLYIPKVCRLFVCRFRACRLFVCRFSVCRFSVCIWLAHVFIAMKILCLSVLWDIIALFGVFVAIDLLDGYIMSKLKMSLFVSSM